MNSRIVFLFAVSLLATLLPGSLLAGDGLTPHIAEYRVRISVLGGELRTRFETTATGYQAQSTIEATGMSRLVARGAIREHSMFSLHADGIRPDVYRSVDSLSSDGQVVDLAFDWDDYEVSGLIDGAEYRSSLEAPVHDRVTLQYGLMHDLINGEERQRYLLQDAEELKVLSIRNAGHRTIEVPFGTFEAVGIQHQAENSSRITTLWCVEELGYLPAVIEQHRKGKLRLRAELTNYVPLDSAVAQIGE